MPTQVIENKLPTWWSNTLKNARVDALKERQSSPVRYPGFNVVPSLSGATRSGMAGMQTNSNNGVMNGPQVFNAHRQMAQQGFTGGLAGNEMQKILGGDYLHGGDAYNEAVNAATRHVLPQIQSQFGGSGRHSSGLADVAMARELGDAHARQYGSERDRMMAALNMAQGNQMGALSMAPDMENLSYSPQERMLQVGGIQDQYNRDRNKERANKYWYEQNTSGRRLDDYISRIGQLSPSGAGSQFTNAPSKSNPFGQALGGAAAGFASGGPLGAAVGGLLPLLGGIFS